jgi:hypothetical protein
VTVQFSGVSSSSVVVVFNTQALGGIPFSISYPQYNFASGGVVLRGVVYVLNTFTIIIF